MLHSIVQFYLYYQYVLYLKLEKDLRTLIFPIIY